MSTFPRLKTGAVMQYPASRTAHYSTQVFRFVDGSEQRYREYATPIRRWIIRLELLDEEETSRLRQFFISMQGRSGAFEFEDPWDDSVHSNCSLENDELVVEFLGEARGRTALIVRENRN